MTPYTNYSSEMNRMHREAMHAEREQIRLAKLARAESRQKADNQRETKYRDYWESVRRIFATAPPTVRYAYLRQATRA